MNVPVRRFRQAVTAAGGDPPRRGERVAGGLQAVPGAAGGGQWQTLYVAPNEAVAAMIREYLTQSGFLVMLRTAGVIHMGASAAFEVLVPALEVAEAHEALAALLAGGGVEP